MDTSVILKHTVTQKHLDKLKSRWDKLTQEDLDTHFDEGIVDILKVINAHPEVVTVFSCTGHLPSASPPTGYVMLATTNDNAVSLLYKVLTIHLNTLFSDAPNNTARTHLVGCILNRTMRQWPFASSSRTALYPVWILRWRSAVGEETPVSTAKIVHDAAVQWLELETDPGKLADWIESLYLP